MDRLQDELQEATPQTGVLDSLQGQLQEQLSEETMYSDTYQDSVVAKDTLDAEMKTLKAQLTEADSAVSEHENKIKKAKNREVRLEEIRQKAVFEKNEFYAKIKDAEEARDALHSDRDVQRQTILEHTEQAQKISDRVAIDDGETGDSLQAKLTALLEQIERSKRE